MNGERIKSERIPNSLKRGYETSIMNFACFRKSQPQMCAYYGLENSKNFPNQFHIKRFKISCDVIQNLSLN